MKSQRALVAITIVVAAIVSGGGVYIWQVRFAGARQDMWRQIAQYNCEQSGGTFGDERCHCPSEFGIDVYDRYTGYCEITVGGPGGAMGKVIEDCTGCKFALDQCRGEKQQ